MLSHEPGLEGKKNPLGHMAAVAKADSDCALH
jgi:hypothetical protein